MAIFITADVFLQDIGKNNGSDRLIGYNYHEIAFGEEHMSIGFFDSGVGGITVLAEALRQLPQENYIYYADTDHVPYGTKSKDAVRKYVLEAAEFMAAQGIKALVVACNTATSIAITDLRAKFSFPILGMEPAVKPAVEKNGSKRILVTATPLTLREEKYQNLITRFDPAHIVDGLALPELVDFAERFVFDRNVVKSYLMQKLSAYDLSLYGTVVLGCTHFPFYKECFKEVFPVGTDIIDGSTGTVNYLKKIMTAHGLGEDGRGEITYYASKKKIEDGRFEKYLNKLRGANSISQA